jgi:hypothetical protein
MDRIEATGAAAVAAGNVGCILQIARKIKERGSPVEVVHVPPQRDAGSVKDPLVVRLSANPFMAEGTLPVSPLKALCLAHCAPQKFTILP